MKAFGYRHFEWASEPFHVRAELIAHEDERSLREAWEYEQLEAARDPKSKKLGSPVSAWVSGGAS